MQARIGKFPDDLRLVFEDREACVYRLRATTGGQSGPGT
jgi:hypothetical protein